MNNRTGNQRGLALITVLWVLVLLSLIAASFTHTIRTEVNLTRNLIDNAKAEALADAGVYRAIAGLLDTDLARQWRADGTVYAFALGEGEARISIQNEGGKVDLNEAKDELIRGLFILAGLEAEEADEMVDRIVDFRDEDDLHRLQGAEDRDYEDAGLPWDAKDRPFEAVEELQQVMGMTQALYKRVAPFLTVYSKMRTLDPTAASPELLAVVPGFDIAQLPAVLAELANRANVMRVDLPIDQATKQYISVLRVQVYTIRAEARIESGAVFVREAVIDLKRVGDALYRVLAWKQGERAAPAEGEGEGEPE